MNMLESLTSVTGDKLFGVSKLLDDHQLDSKEFYAQFGLQPSIEDAQNVLVPFQTLIEIFERLKEVLPYRHPAIKLSQIQVSKGSDYYELISNAPTLDIGLKLTHQYRSHYSGVTHWDWFCEGGQLFIKLTSFTKLEANDKEHCLFALTQAFSLIMRNYGKHSDLMYVSLLQPREEGHAEIQQFFQCPIRYDQEFNGFVYSEETLHRPNEAYDANTHSQCLSSMNQYEVIFPENQSFSTTVKILVANRLRSGNFNIEDIAAILNIHCRTLQNRLKNEGMNFKQLVNEVRFVLAKRLLMHRTIPLMRICYILGYSEYSAFCRSYKKQSGLSPKQWRKHRLSEVRK